MERANIAIMMLDSATAAERFRANRICLRLSQSRLARLSRVSRFKICNYELGDGSLTADEQNCIRAALEEEAKRLRQIAGHFQVGLGERNE